MQRRKFCEYRVWYWSLIHVSSEGPRLHPLRLLGWIWTNIQYEALHLRIQGPRDGITKKLDAVLSEG